MDLTTLINQNVSSGNTLFEPKYINVEYLFYKVYLFLHEYFGVGSERLTGSSSGDVAGTFIDTSNKVSKAGDIFKTMLYIFILFALTVICYCFVRILEIRKREHDYMHHETHEYYHKRAELAKKTQEVYKSNNPRWQAVIEYTNSHNENDWRLAILEADSVLDSLLDSLEFKGDSVGEKLKTVNFEKFPKLNTAWEVHNIRNKIAHEGLNFQIYQNELKRVIHIYEQIFRDYNFI